MNERFVKKKESSAFVVAFCFCVAIAIEIAGGVLIAIGVGEEFLNEKSMLLAAHIIRILSTVSASVLAWIYEKDNKMLSSAVTAILAIVVPAIAAMLFWRIDGTKFAVNAAISAASYLLFVWLLRRMGSRKQLGRYKKHYR